VSRVFAHFGSKFFFSKHFLYYSPYFTSIVDTIKVYSNLGAGANRNYKDCVKIMKVA
jgi:hypothetical protein